MIKLTTLATIVLASLSMNAQSQEVKELPLRDKAANHLVEQLVDGYFIVKFKDTEVHKSLMQTPETNTMLRVQAKGGSPMSVSSKYNVSVTDRTYGESMLESLPTEVEHVRSLSLSNDLVKVSLNDRKASKVMLELMQTGLFEYVEQKRIYQPFSFDSSEYNDAFYSSQTHFGNWSVTNPVGSGYADARSATVDNRGTKVRIGVIDSGSYTHEDVDFVGGYDFATFEGINANGEVITKERDADPTDEYTNEEGVTCNSGHGLAVSSFIAAKSNNNVGIAGAVDSDLVEIVPLRALGCSGGASTDILEGALWLAGESIPGVPDIETPVDIINMSLGGLTNGGCPEYEQEVFDRLHELGVTVVVAAGNENMEVNNVIPASCANLITVGAISGEGDRASYSNYGDKVDLVTIGGTLIGAGLSQTVDNEYISGSGTSFATPLVAATAANLLLKYPNLTPTEIEALLKSNVVDNSELGGSETSCGRLGCGTGVLQANEALVAIDNVTTVTDYEVVHRYEGYDSEADAVWLQQMSSYVNACDLVKYTWGDVGVELSGVTYNLFLSENGGEMVQLETVTIPQKVYNLPSNSVLGVQACSNGTCGTTVEMPVNNIVAPASCQ